MVEVGLRDLAELSGVSMTVLVQLESGGSGDHRAASCALQRALESCGIEFGPDGWIRHREDACQVAALETPAQQQTGLGARKKKLADTIGTAWRRARKANRLTQEDAATKIGVSVEFYSRIERGNALPSVPTFARAMQVLGIEIDSVFGRYPSESRQSSRSHALASTAAAEFSAKAFGAACRRARHAMQLTQEDVSERVGITAEFYARLERGKAIPSIPTLWHLARALGLRSLA